MKPPFYFRYLIITLICGILGVAIIVQMVRINYSHTAQELISKSADYQGVEQLIYPPRGMIYDRSGNILATNKTAYELGIDLKFVVDPESIAFAAASLFEDLDYEEVYDLANTEKQANENRYFVLASYVSEKKILELEQLEENYKARRIESRSTKPSLQGLVWSSMQQRTYPEQSLAANVLGFYNYFSRETAQGVYGVEEAYNRLLTGKPAKVFMPNDPYLVEALPDIASGASLVLTIDREIQSMLEETLSDAIEWSGAEGGTIIVADPETGEILGMTSTPFFDPNKYWEYEETFPGPTPYNRAVGTAYEPGSVFKVITMAAALDSGVAQPETTYTDSTGVYWVEDSWPIYNWDGGAWGEQDMTGCMKHSLNVCLAYIACDLLEEDLFYEYLQAFGFGKSTGIDLAGEANFPMRLPEDNEWVILDLATNAFGQGIAVTPIQMVTAISAIANDGKMMMPHVVKSVVDQGLQYDISPQLINTPITAETAEILTQMLTIALEEEASAAMVDGYSLAGKTGTGEIPTELGYTSSQTNTSFVGWGPSNDPKFVVYVWLEKPSISKWGSEVAAPVFQDVVEKLVVLMKIPPDDVRLTLNSD
ncbi:MAG: penicillin-binding protein 2 [Chloroflexota bacterium]|jgi:cell division protein FtsI/penicillin-binding protein 2|nr:penicillin-binding protein 2 [Chloroflexota bacterium]